jgi:D-hydroxyproline dehydrogenase subunit alpha
VNPQTEIAIIGAGPAGLRAAIAAARTGAQVTLIDGYLRPGGQYYRQLPLEFASDDHTVHHKQAQELLAQLAAAGVRVITNTTVWGAFGASGGTGPAGESRGGARCQLALYGPDAPPALEAQALILATGAYDRPIPFPGWTLPGVMTAGAVQTLIKSQRVLPGRRVLLAGTGPLQLAVAAALVQAGAEVVAVLEGASFDLRRVVREASALWGQGQRLGEGWDYGRTLAAAGVPYRNGWSIRAARGDGEVQVAEIGRVDRDWRPVPGTEETLAVDTVVCGFGFIPATELTRLLGCRHEFAPERGGYVPWRDAEMGTSLPGVYAVGDGAGIGGAELAGLEGEIAGLVAARHVRAITDAAARQRMAALMPRLASQRRFAGMLGRLFTPGPGTYTLATDNTIICRCEEVTLGDIRTAAAAGVRSVNELKGVTRIGMGNCQGRTCGELAARLLAAACGGRDDDLQAVVAAGLFTARPPIHPLPLSVLAEAVPTR